MDDKFTLGKTFDQVLLPTSLCTLLLKSESNSHNKFLVLAVTKHPKLSMGFRAKRLAAENYYSV